MFNIKKLFLLLCCFWCSLTLYAQLDCGHPLNGVINCTADFMPIEICNATTVGRANNVSLYGTLNDGHTGGEDIYILDIKQDGLSQGVTVNIVMDNFSGDLDLFLLEECSPFSVVGESILTAPTETINFSSSGFAGPLYIVVDGWDESNSTYDITIDVTYGNGASGNPISSVTEEINDLEDAGIDSYCPADFPLTGEFFPFIDIVGTPSAYQCGINGIAYDLKAYARYYRIETDSPGDIRVDLSNGNADIRSFIYRTAPTQVGSCSSNNFVDCSVCVGTFGSVFSDAVYTNAPAGVYYIIVDAPFDGAGFDIDIDFNNNNCQGNYGCDDCTECFHYLPKEEEPRVFSFYSNYCPSQDPQFTATAASTPSWEVQDANGNAVAVTYLEGTTVNSADPVIEFPVPGTYRVCQFDTDFDEVYIVCCVDVYVPGAPCYSPPFCEIDYSYNANNGEFTFNASSTVGAASYDWNYSIFDIDPLTSTDGSFFKCKFDNLSFQNCQTICLTATNACGFSSYCVEICEDASEVCGYIPPNYPLMTPVVNDNQVTFSGIPVGGEYDYDWSVIGGAFVNGTSAGSANPVIEYPENGNYIVCLTLTDSNCQKVCLCWTVYVNDEEDPCDDSLCGACDNNNCTDISYAYTGSPLSSALNYSFNFRELNEGEELCRWEIYQGQSPGEVPLATSTGLAYGYDFPSVGFYTVCFYYYNQNNGNLFRCCRTIFINNPFNCGNDDITYYTTDGNNFVFQFNGSGYTDLTWTDDETGNIIGTGSNSNPVIAPVNCIYKDISVRYRDPNTGCWYSCCVRVRLCPPVDCENVIDYDWDAGQGKYRFTFTGSDVNPASIVWQNDNTGNQFGFGQTETLYNFGLPCTEQFISIRYRDSSGRWYLCCRRVYLCNPFTCGNIFVSATDGGTGSTLSIDNGGGNFSDIVWVVNGQSAGSGSSIDYPINPEQEYQICVYYRSSLTGCWYVCCRNVTGSCTPPVSAFSFNANNLTANFTNNSVSSAGGGITSVLWNFGDGTTSTQYNPTHTYANAGTYNVCLQVTDACDNTTSCQTVTVSAPTGDPVTFSTPNDFCGAPGALVSIPVSVDNWIGARGFGMSIDLSNSLIGNITGGTTNSAAGIGSISFALNGNTLSCAYFQSTEVDIPNGTVLFYVTVQLSQAITCADVLISGTPTLFEVYNSAGPLPVAAVTGAVCIKNDAEISGTVRKDAFGGNAPVGLVNVQLNGQSMTTNTDGNFSFTGLNAGSNYTLTPAKNINPKNGVTLFDAIKIQDHTLNIPDILPTPYSRIAADVNSDGNITLFDAILIQDLTLNSITEFPGTPSWKFVSTDYNFTTNAPESENYAQNRVYNPLSGAQSNQDFIGIKMGDVTYDANTTQLTQDAVTDGFAQTDIAFYTEDNTAAPGASVSVPIYFADFEQLRGLGIPVTWDASVLTYVGISEGTLSSGNLSLNTQNTDSGNLSVSWFSSDCFDFPTDTPAFYLDFTVVGAAGTSTEVGLTESFGSIEAIDCSPAPLAYTFTNGTVTAAEEQEPLAAGALVFDVSCFGESSGSIAAAALGGSGDYSFLWNNGDTNSFQDNLPAGTYSVTVTDNETGEISILANLTVEQPSALNGTTSVTNADLNADNGKIDVNVTGGTPPYTYAWNTSPPQNSAQACDLSPGFYTVTVTDDNGCTETYTATVQQANESLSLFLANITHPDCTESSTGSITVGTNGGSGSFAAEWSSGDTGLTAENLPAGDYSVTVTDSETGETAAGNYALIDPPVLSVTGMITNETNGLDNGAIFFEGTGGTPPYTVEYPDEGVTGSALDNLSAGVYTLVVTDAAGCVLTIPVTVDNLTAVRELISEAAIDLFPNPNDGSFSIRFAGDLFEDDPKISVYSVAGQRHTVDVNRAAAASGESLSIRADLLPGVYILAVQDEQKTVYRRFLVQ